MCPKKLAVGGFLLIPLYVFLFFGIVYLVTTISHSVDVRSDLVAQMESTTALEVLALLSLSLCVAVVMGRFGNRLFAALDRLLDYIL